jgi:hypothetical protein
MCQNHKYKLVNLRGNNNSNWNALLEHEWGLDGALGGPRSCFINIEEMKVLSDLPQLALLIHAHAPCPLTPTYLILILSVPNTKKSI